MDSMLTGINHWHWWVIAVVLVILEAFVSGAHLLWLGISAGIVGLMVFLLPALGWEYQVLWFAIFSVAAIAAWRTYQHRHPAQTDQPTLNRRGEQYVGRTFNLPEPIVNGRGKIKVDDSTWRVEGPDCATGTAVRVISCEGTILRVEPSVH